MIGGISALIAAWVIFTMRSAIAAAFAASPVTMVLVALLVGWGIAWKFYLGKNSGVRSVEGHHEKERDIIATVIVLAAGLLYGLHLATAASDFAPKPSQAAVMQIATGWALGYFAVGFVTGFLFGIPRVLQGDGSRKPGQDGSGYEQRVNTNLEQISDWLTKIIVGLGLVELRTVPDQLHKAAQWMAQSFVPGTSAGATPPEAATSFAGALIIFFSVLGFLGGYLTTRLFLAGAFSRADRGQVVVEEKSVASLITPGGEDKTDADKLRRYWKPSGDTADPARKIEIENWLKEKGRGEIKLGDLMFLQEYADLRKEAVAHFKL